MKHIVEASELENFTFEQVVCSAWPKCLSVYVHPAKCHMHYKLAIRGLEVGKFNSLEVALLEYNQL